MLQGFQKQFYFQSPDETSLFAQKLAPVLNVGDVLLLEGHIGAGKTHFARSLIQARLSAANLSEAVPSPTFTLVQTYDDGNNEIWHADLYRLLHPDEVEELGLLDAFDSSICVVEWPDRLGDLSPTGALTLAFTTSEDPDMRKLDVASASPRWAEVFRKANL